MQKHKIRSLPCFCVSRSLVSLRAFPPGGFLYWLFGLFEVMYCVFKQTTDILVLFNTKIQESNKGKTFWYFFTAAHGRGVKMSLDIKDLTLLEGEAIDEKVFYSKAIGAIRNNDVKALKNLLENSAPYGINSFADECAKNGYFHGRGWLAIAVDLNAGRRVIRFLAENGADVNTRDDPEFLETTPLIHAALKGSHAISGLLLKMGADPNITDTGQSSPLMFAAENNACKTIKTLLSYGADVNAKDECGAGALTIAILNGNEEAVRILLDGGANVNDTDKAGIPPLFHAANSEKMEALIPVLVEAGVDTGYISRKGENLLLRVIDARAIDVFGVYDVDSMVSFILENKLVKNIFHRDKAGDSALMRAIRNNQPDVVKLLVAEGFTGERLDKANRRGITPVQAAIKKGNVLILDMLLSAGAGDAKTNPEWGSNAHAYINSFENMDKAYEAFLLALSHEKNEYADDTTQTVRERVGKIAGHIQKHDSISITEKEVFALLATLVHWPEPCNGLRSVWSPIRRKVLETVVKTVSEHVPRAVSPETVLSVFMSDTFVNSPGDKNREEPFPMRIEDSAAQTAILSILLGSFDSNPGLAISFLKKIVGKQLEEWSNNNVCGAKELVARIALYLRKSEDTRKRPVWIDF